MLEAGPFLLPEHVQDIPSLALSNPGTQAPFPPGSGLPATRQELIAQGNDKKTISEAWGLPWNSTERFGGLAYCLGGRSLYFGGWSPRYLDTEMPTAPVGTIDAGRVWPVTVVQDLKPASSSKLQSRPVSVPPTTTSMASCTGSIASNSSRTIQRYRRPCRWRKCRTMWSKQPTTLRPGSRRNWRARRTQAFRTVSNSTLRCRFRRCKFDLVSSPLTSSAVFRSRSRPRARRSPSRHNDPLKRLDDRTELSREALAHTRLHAWRRARRFKKSTGSIPEVDSIDLSGTVAGNPNCRPLVVLAAGAMESARLALLSAGNVPNAGEMGANLMVHLRKNVIFTAALPAALGLKQQELCVLLVRCRATLGDGTPVHFHLQITASAVPAGSGAGKSDALLFQNVPDLDNVRIFSETAPGEVDVSIRAVGEMLPNPQNNAVTVPLQPADTDEYIVPRASVEIPTRRDVCAARFC